MTITNRRIVEDLYAAIRRRDTQGLESIIACGFAPDAVMTLSDSLPYGGAHTGAARIEDLLLALVRARTPMVQPDAIEVRRIVADGDHVVAEVVFPWRAPGAGHAIIMSATEWFTFRGGRVAEMRVGYWDTAACVRAQEAARARRVPSSLS